MASTIKTAMLDPDIMFGQDVIADPEIAPQLQDRERTPIKAYRKGTFPHRKPDISTPEQMRISPGGKRSHLKIALSFYLVAQSAQNRNVMSR